MSSQPDSDIPQAEIPRNSAEVARSGTEGFEPASSQPDNWEMVTADFDAISLFPSESEATAEESSESVSLTREEQGTQPAPALGSQAGTDTLKNERAALADLRAQLRQTEAAIQESLGEAGALKTELDQVRALAAQLTRDYSTIKEASREAREDSGTAMAAFKDIEQRLGGLTSLCELSAQTHERLAALDALAEDVTRKTRALENQKYLIERTLVEANRLNEMVRAKNSHTANWVSHRRRLSHALTILVTQTPSWAVQHRTHVLGGLGVLALVSFLLMRFVGGVDRIGANEVVPQAQPALNSSSPGTPGTMKEPVATSTQTAETALEQPSREAKLAKPPVRAREFIGALAVQSDPAGAAVFINRRPVGTTPLRVRRLSAGSHAVWVEREGYERWTAAVRVPADRLTRVNVKLRREAVSVAADRPSNDPVIAAQETSPGQKQKSHPIVRGVKGLGRGIRRLFAGN